MVKADRLALAAGVAVDMDAAPACVGQSPSPIWFEIQLGLLAAYPDPMPFLAKVKIHLHEASGDILAVPLCCADLLHW